MHIYKSKHCNPDFDESFVRDTLVLAAEALTNDNPTLNGRGAVFVREDCTPNIIVRRYRRGGLFGKIISHQYFRNPLDFFPSKPEPSVRMIRELSLLDQMTKLNLPCPKPVAAAIDLHKLSYEGYLLTEYIPDSITLASFLLKQNLSSDRWQSIGSTIRSFHDHQVYHSDLNATNILLDTNQKTYLIDFDKCLVKQGENWKQANLDRLLRSLKKFAANHSQFNFDDHRWQQLTNGYKAPSNKPLT